jgi:hypothetical protein
MLPPGTDGWRATLNPQFAPKKPKFGGSIRQVRKSDIAKVGLKS